MKNKVIGIFKGRAVFTGAGYSRVKACRIQKNLEQTSVKLSLKWQQSSHIADAGNQKVLVGSAAIADHHERRVTGSPIQWLANSYVYVTLTCE